MKPKFAHVANALALLALFVALTSIAAPDKKSAQRSLSNDGLYAEYFEPLIPVGYKPALDTDEGGLWQTMDRYEKELQGSALLIDDAALNAYLSGLVCKLAPDYCGDIRVYVTNNPYFNASMAPNGVMQIWSGLLLRVDNEAQLASVIGHELAHYLQKHSLAQWRRAKTTSAFAGVLSLAGGAVGSLVSMGVMGSLFSFSREQERDADLYGLQLLDRAGYDTKEAGLVWKTIIEEDERALHKSKKGGWLASHPRPESRVQELTQQANIVEIFNDDERQTNRDEYYQAIEKHYLPMMERMLKAKQFGRIQYLLERHEKSRLPRGMYHFFAGEYYRSAGKEIDYQKAVESYEQSILNDGPPEAFRGAGYAMLKMKDKQSASDYFKQYLAAMPDASDRAMIEFYLTE